MGIEIIGKLTQKNNGDFKLVDLENVDYDGTGKSAKQELEKKIEDAKNSSTPYDDSAIKKDIQTLKDNEVTLVKDEISMEGIKDNEYPTLTTQDKTLIGSINEVNAQFKDIANVYAKKDSIFFSQRNGNLIDNDNFTITQSKYLNGNTGEIAIANSDDYWVIENYIQIEVGKTYVFNSSLNWLYCYDATKKYIKRVQADDCSVTWKKATVPEGTVYARLYVDRSTNSYKNLYLFEYDPSLTYGTNVPEENTLPQVGYTYNTNILNDNIKQNLIDTIIPKQIKDFSKLIFEGCNVKIIGDSITAGQGGSNFNANFNTSGGELITSKIWSQSWYTNDTGTCWANSLKAYLTQKFNCTVKNYGCPGIGVDQMITAIDDLVKDEDDLVICMIGTNNRHNMQLTELYSKLEQIYNIITIQKNKKIIMMSCMPASVLNETSNNRIFHADDIDNMYFKLSCEKNFEYISIYKEVLRYCNLKGINVDTLLNDDGLHPNDNGYNVMFNIICNKLGFGQKRDGATW